MTIRRGWEAAIRDGCYNKWYSRLTAVLLAAAAAFAQTPETLGRAYRESPAAARGKALEQFAASHKDTMARWRT